MSTERRTSVLRARRAGVRRDGFTLIEVMIAVGIITVGSLGILAMQSATIRGNAESRQMSIATQRTRTWIDRLESDALMWNLAGAQPANRSQTLFLRNVTAPTAIPVFEAPLNHPPPRPDARLRPGASFAGIDVEDADGPVYCTHVELTWAVQGELIRARVRTTFHRQTGTQYALSIQCATNAAAVTADLASPTPNFRAVTATTLIRWRPM